MGGRTDGGGGGDGWNGNGERLNMWEDNIANITLGREPNAPLTYTPGLEQHNPIMSMLWEAGSRLERYRDMVQLPQVGTTHRSVLERKYTI